MGVPLSIFGMSSVGSAVYLQYKFVPVRVVIQMLSTYFLYCSFAESRIGWKEEKVNEVLLPVLKKMNAKDSTQTKVTQFFTKSTAPQSTATRGKAIKSRRIRNAIARIRGMQF